MAAPTTPKGSSRSSSSAALEVTSSPIAAGMMAAEYHEHADRVAREADADGQGRVRAARVRGIRRFASQLDALAAPAEGRPAVGLDVVAAPIAAGMMGAELTEHAGHVSAEAGESGPGRILAARLAAIERFAAQLEGLAATEGDQ